MKYKYEECLSILELLDLSDGNSMDVGARAHVEGCSRCSVLYKSLDLASSDDDDISSPPKPDLTITPPLQSPTPDLISGGQLWRVSIGGCAEVVAIVGISRQLERAFIATVASPEIEQATDLDLIIHDSVLEYPFMLSAWNFGTMLGTQLDQFLGSLSSEDLDRLRELHKHIITGRGRPPTGVGVPVSSSQDPRLLWQNRELERTRPLWREANSRVAALADAEDPGKDRSSSLGSLLNLVLSSDEWELNTLVEAAKIESSHLQTFLDDRLDLTEQTDIEPLAKVIRVLGLTFQDVESAIETSLWKSEGGELKGRRGFHKLAARASKPSVARSDRDIYRGLEELDKSDAARKRSIADYLGHLEELLETRQRN